MLKTEQSPFYTTKLIGLDKYFDQMLELYKSNSFPKVILLNGKKGIGKFTLIFHFLNYIYSINEKNPYDTMEKLISVKSIFYNMVLNQSCSDVIFFQAKEGGNIKIDDVRNLKSTLSKSTLTGNPRFIIIDEVEFLNINSVNALLKTLEEPTLNNYFILINNQQADLIDTISSRCLKNNIYLNFDQRTNIIDYLVKSRKINLVFDDHGNLTPGLLLNYNELYNKYKIDNEENILLKLKKLLHGYKKDKNKDLPKMCVFLIEQFFYNLVKDNENRIDFLLNIKLFIIKKINDFITYNLNVNTVIKSIELKINNVRQ